MIGMKWHEMKSHEIIKMAQAHEHPLMSEIEPLTD